MDTNNKNTTIPETGNIAIYLRYPIIPRDESVIQQRLHSMTTLVAESNKWKLTGVYADIGIPHSQENPFPNFARMKQDFKEGKFNILLTEPPHKAYRELDQGMDYLLELQDFSPRVIFTNGQTIPEIAAISIFRSTMKALTMVEAMADRELEALRADAEVESEQPTMQL